MNIQIKSIINDNNVIEVKKRLTFVFKINPILTIIIDVFYIINVILI